MGANANSGKIIVEIKWLSLSKFWGHVSEDGLALSAWKGDVCSFSSSLACIKVSNLHSGCVSTSDLRWIQPIPCVWHELRSTSFEFWLERFDYTTGILILSRKSQWLWKWPVNCKCHATPNKNWDSILTYPLRIFDKRESFKFRIVDWFLVSQLHGRIHQYNRFSSSERAHSRGYRISLNPRYES